MSRASCNPPAGALHDLLHLLACAGRLQQHLGGCCKSLERLGVQCTIHASALCWIDAAALLAHTPALLQLHTLSSFLPPCICVFHGSCQEACSVCCLALCRLLRRITGDMLYAAAARNCKVSLRCVTHATRHCSVSMTMFVPAAADLCHLELCLQLPGPLLATRQEVHLWQAGELS